MKVSYPAERRSPWRGERRLTTLDPRGALAQKWAAPQCGSPFLKRPKIEARTTRITSDIRWTAGGWIAFGVMGAGTLLRARQLTANASLWLDELALVRNVAERPLNELVLHALDFSQLAPVGFLAVSRLLWTAAPDLDWVLRLVPFIASVATMPLVYLIGLRVMTRSAAVGAVALIAFSPPLVMMAGIVKQYSLDVFVTAAILYGALLLLDGEDDSRARLTKFGLTGGALILFSFPAVIVCFTSVLFLLIRWYYSGKKDWLGRTVAVGLPLGLGASLTTAHALRISSSDTQAFLEAYWQSGFPPGLWTTPVWFWRRLSGVWDSAFLTPYPWPPWHSALLTTAMLGLCLVGAVTLVSRMRSEAGVVLIPIIVALVAASTGLYPLVERLSLFLAPSLAILTAAGTAALGPEEMRLPKQLATLRASVPVVPVTLSLLTTPPPVHLQEMRPLLEEISEEWMTGDLLYSYFAANQSIAYYGPRFGLLDWHPGVCTAPDDTLGQLTQLDGLAGHERVWVVFTHVLPQRRDVVEGMMAHLRETGIEKLALLDHRRSFGTSAYLFDLSAAAPLHSFGPETLTEGVGAPTCGAGPASNWRSRSPG